MSFKGEFWGANHSHLQEPVDNRTQLILGIMGIEGVTRLNHSKGDFDTTGFSIGAKPPVLTR